MSPWRAAYSGAVWLALPFALWRIHRRAQAAQVRIPLREYFGKIPFGKNSDDGQAKSQLGFEAESQLGLASESGPETIWLHAVSVGEAAAAGDLIRALRRRRPQCEWILTCTTSAGRAKLESDFGEFARVAACPLDLPGATREFIRRARPRLAILMEAEYWPNLLAAADRSGAKILLANARLGRANARRYAMANALARETVSRFSAAAAQTRADLRRLKFFGAPDGVVSGNLKFDRVPDPAKTALGKRRRRKLRESGVANPVALFASVREGEGEALVRAADDSFFREHFCVFAPRHPERCAGLAAALDARGIRFSQDSKEEEIGSVGGAHLADSLGEMAAHYALCDAAFVGGGLRGGVGGQNPIEAMSQGVAAAAGPDAANYAELTAAAERAGALRRAADATDAIRILRELCADAEARAAQGKRALQFCAGRRGALEIVLRMAEDLLDGKAGGGF